MLRRDNTAEGGTAGVTIDATNTGGLSGDLFSHVQDAGTTIRFATAAVVHGTLGYEFIGAASASCYLQWTGDAEPSYAIRGYLRASALPPLAASASLAFAQVRTSTGTAASVSLTGDGRFRILDSAGGTAANGTAVISSTTLAAGHRFEFRVTPGTTTTNGTATLQVFVGDAALNTTPLETLTATGNFRTDTPTHVRFGRVTAGTTVWNFWLDDLALQTGSTGYIGPFATPNAAPIPNAGPDQAIDPWSTTVTLTGIDSDADGTVSTRAWSQIAGPTVTLTGTGATRTFTPPTLLDGATLTFRYTVTDNRGQSAADDTTVVLLPIAERIVTPTGDGPVMVDIAVAVTPPPPPPPPPMSALDADVQEARRYYPGGDLAPELAHLHPLVRKTALGIWEIITPEKGGLYPRFYWVPTGSTFTPPADAPGIVYKGRIFNPATNTTLDSQLTASGGYALIETPELFTSTNSTGGLELSNVYASVVLGAEVNMNTWTGSTTPTTIYRTPADMSAGVNGVAMPRGGTWHYPTTAADLDPNNRHRQTIYAQSWTEAARIKTTRGFQAWEGLRTRGEFAYEHFDWNGRGSAAASNFRLVLSGIHMERVGALMHPDSSNKQPGGDGIQIFGGLKECVVIGATVNSTGYQAFFWQNDQSMGGAGAAGYPSLFVVKRANARWEADTVQWGGATTETGPQQWAASTYANNGTYVDVQDVYVYRPSRSRGQLIGGTYPTVTVAEHDNFVDATKVGLAYVPLGV